MAVHMLCEGSSIRAIERMTGVHRDTVMRLGVRVGQGCKKLMDEKMRNLTCENVQVDEVWGFIGAKAKTVKLKNLSAEYGDMWSWIAIDADTNLVPCFAVGDRSKYMAQCFMDDLAARVNGRVQISSDALKAYVDAIERAFGSEVDYGTVVKEFRHSDLDSPNTRYSPPDVLKVKKTLCRAIPSLTASPPPLWKSSITPCACTAAACPASPMPSARAGELRSGDRSALRLLQLLQDPWNASHDASNGSRHHGPASYG